MGFQLKVRENIKNNSSQFIISKIIDRKGDKNAKLRYKTTLRVTTLLT